MGASLKPGSALPGLQPPDGLAGQDSRVTPAPGALHGMNRPEERTLLIARCCSEAPLPRGRKLSAKPSRPFCLQEKRTQLVPPPRPSVVTMQPTATQDNRGKTEQGPNPALEHHASGSHFSVTDRLGATR